MLTSSGLLIFFELAVFLTSVTAFWAFSSKCLYVLRSCLNLISWDCTSFSSLDIVAIWFSYLSFRAAISTLRPCSSLCNLWTEFDVSINHLIASYTELKSENTCLAFNSRNSVSSNEASATILRCTWITLS